MYIFEFLCFFRFFRFWFDLGFLRKTTLNRKKITKLVISIGFLCDILKIYPNRENVMQQDVFKYHTYGVNTMFLQPDSHKGRDILFLYKNTKQNLHDRKSYQPWVLYWIIHPGNVENFYPQYEISSSTIFDHIPKTQFSQCPKIHFLNFKTYEKYVFPQELVLGVESTLRPMYWCLYSDTVFTDMLSREVLFWCWQISSFVTWSPCTTKIR